MKSARAMKSFGMTQTELGTLPAQERLHPHHPPRRQLQAGLIVERHLALFEGPAQALLERAPLEGLLRHRRREQLEVVSSALLGAVHRGVGAPHERLLGLSVLRVEGDAAARGHPHLVPVDREGLPEPIRQLSREIVATSSA